MGPTRLRLSICTYISKHVRDRDSSEPSGPGAMSGTRRSPKVHMFPNTCVIGTRRSRRGLEPCISMHDRNASGPDAQDFCTPDPNANAPTPPRAGFLHKRMASDTGAGVTARQGTAGHGTAMARPGMAYAWHGHGAGICISIYMSDHINTSTGDTTGHCTMFWRVFSKDRSISATNTVTMHRTLEHHHHQLSCYRPTSAAGRRIDFIDFRRRTAFTKPRDL